MYPNISAGVRSRFMVYVVFVAIGWVSGCDQPLADDAIELRSNELTESSGVAVSHLNPSIFWTHNDSGDGARLFAFDLAGNCVAELEVDDVQAFDWEDMCSFTRDGQTYLAVGDTGDNSRRRKKVAIYVFAEPKLEVADQVADNSRPAVLHLKTSDVLTIEVEYPTPVDCESLAYDPRRGEFLLCSKEPLSSGLYRVPFELEFEDGKKRKKKNRQEVTVRAEQYAPVPLATAADISADGNYLIIGTYGPAFVLARGPDDTWDVSSEHSKLLSLPKRRQGEAICFSQDGQRLMVTSELKPTPLWNIPFDLATAATADQ